MESISYNDIEIAIESLKQMIEACDLLIEWNKDVANPDEFAVSPSGLQKLAANSMLIEAIGEGVKSIDKRLPGFLEKEKPEAPWRQIKGMRDRIAHGYFNIDATYVYSIVKDHINPLKEMLMDIKESLLDMAADYYPQ